MAKRSVSWTNLRADFVFCETLFLAVIIKHVWDLSQNLTKHRDIPLETSGMLIYKPVRCVTVVRNGVKIAFNILIREAFQKTPTLQLLFSSEFLICFSKKEKKKMGEEIKMFIL